jgi:hypothetical protein
VAQYGWSDPPPQTRAQLKSFQDAVQQIVGQDLIGIYLHGSLAMGCFNPQRSDVDLLAVTGRGMAVEVKRELGYLLLARSRNPHPLEISFLRGQDLHPWQYPTSFDLHYSEMWREQYRQHLHSGEWRTWNERQYRDPDLAAHITLTLQRGIRLHGRPIADVFPRVSKEDYVASLLDDFEGARDEIAQDPVYGVLNMCRVYWYLLDDRISSKDEAAVWAIDFLPPAFRALVDHALQVHRGQDAGESFAAAELRTFASYLDRQVQGLRQQQGGA